MRLRRSTAVVLAGLTTLAVGTGVGGSAIAGDARVCGDTTQVLQKGLWRTIDKPKELAQLTASAAGGPGGQTIVASDGKVVMRSTDFGCTWKQTHSLAEAGALEGLPRITELRFTGGGADAGRVILMVVDGVGQAAGSRLFRSVDGGASFQQAGDGLPLTGRLARIEAAVSNPQIVYVTVAVGDGVQGDATGLTGRLYASDDGGDTWQQREVGPLADIAVDPIQADTLFAASKGGQVLRSTSGGKSWTALPIPANDSETSLWRDVAVSHRRGDDVTVVASAAPEPTANVDRVVASPDAGRTWIDLDAGIGGPPGGLVFGAVPGQLLSSVASSSTGFRGPGMRQYDSSADSWKNVDSLDLKSLRDPQTLRGASGSLSANGSTAVYLRRDAPGDAPDLIARYDVPVPTEQRLLPDPRPQCKSKGQINERVDTSPRGTFSPGRFATKLQPGVTGAVPLKVDIPKLPQSLDVYFLLDTSTSMEPAIDAVFCNVERIASELTQTDVDVHFGLGHFRGKEMRYQRLIDISPPSDKIRTTLQDLFTAQGVGETWRTALYQTATGNGLLHREATEENPEAPPTEILPPGQQASFRDGALKTVLNFTDEPWDDEVEDEPPPQLVTGALKEQGIIHVGLPLMINNAPTDAPANARLLTQMDQISRESGSLAPAGGVDCDGNGTVDVQGGQPLVCQLGAKGIKGRLDDTILSILRGIVDTQRARIVPKETSGLTVLVKGADARLNVNQPGVLEGSADITCSKNEEGKKLPVSFDAVVGRRTVATLTGEVICGALPAAVVLPPRLRREPAPKEAAPATPKPTAPKAVVSSPPAPPTAPNPSPAVAVAPTPAPPSPAPINAPSPAQAPAPAASQAPASAQAPTPQAGMAGAQATRPQVQTAQVRADEHQAVAVRRPSALARASATSRAYRTDSTMHHSSATPALITLGLGVSGCFGYVLVASHRTRRRISLAQQRYGRLN